MVQAEILPTSKLARRSTSDRKLRQHGSREGDEGLIPATTPVLSTQLPPSCLRPASSSLHGTLDEEGGERHHRGGAATCTAETAAAGRDVVDADEVSALRELVRRGEEDLQTAAIIGQRLLETQEELSAELEVRLGGTSTHKHTHIYIPYNIYHTTAEWYGGSNRLANNQYDMYVRVR